MFFHRTQNSQIRRKHGRNGYKKEMTGIKKKEKMMINILVEREWIQEQREEKKRGYMRN